MKPDTARAEMAERIATLRANATHQRKVFASLTEEADEAKARALRADAMADEYEQILSARG